MKTYATEDNRKDQLFAAWIEHLTEIHSSFEEKTECEDSYEGLIKIQKMTEKYMNIELEDGRKLRGIPISQEIYKNTQPDDMVYTILGRIGSKWLPLDIISIGSLINKKNGMFHLTVNPIHHAEMLRARNSTVH